MNDIEELPNGQWVVAGDTHLGAWAKEHGNIVTDPYLFRFLKPHLAHVKVVWDIGANIGDHTRKYLDWGMTVVAVEPNPAAFRCLVHNCPDALAFNIAASDTEAEMRFATSSNVGASRIDPEGGITVPARPMDDLSDKVPVPDFVKIDVEGWEVHALTGMLETLRKRKPILYVEVNRGALAANGKTLEDIMNLLLGLGYTDFNPYPLGVRWTDPQFDILAK